LKANTSLSLVGLTISSSATSLIASPGLDGISLREAILATNATGGAQTICITFAPTMAGEAISLGSHLPGVRRDHVTILGLLSADGQPSVTIDARAASGSPIGNDYALPVQASDVTISRLRFTGVDWESYGRAIGIVPGNAVPGDPPGPQQISDVRVEDNLFDNSGFDFPPNGPRLIGIDITSFSPSPNTQVSRVTIAHNTFRGYSGDAHAVHIGPGSDGASITEITIRENHFERNRGAIELSAYEVMGGRLGNTSIVGNTFTQNSEAISLNIGASDTVFEDMLIAGNVISAPGIGISPGDPLGGAVPTGNVIRRTRIVNNLITQAPGSSFAEGKSLGVSIRGGGGIANRIEGVELWNNTIVSTSPSNVLLRVSPNIAVGNTIEGVVVGNSIFWAPGRNFDGDVTPVMVRNSLTTMPGFAGLNGNVSADPRFLNPAVGDFRFQAGSPAIDAGTSDGAPSTDLECRTRSDDPATPNTGTGAATHYDMGAFEYGSAPTARLTVIKDGIGNGVVNAEPAGNDCVANSSPVFNIGTVVTLTPMPASDSTFGGWSGDPDCSDGVVTMASNKTCIATFNARPLVVLGPNGGETWDIGTTQTISWRSNIDIGKVTIMLSRDGGDTWERLFKKAKNKGSKSWTVEGPATDRARIRVSSKNDPSVIDTSDVDFVIR
jgi:hypothetical protein